MNKILKVLALGAMALSTTACSDFSGSESENSGVGNRIL